MGRYILKRVLLLIPVLLGVLTVMFILQEVTPGDPVDQIVGIDAPEETKEAAREEWGLNDPVIVRYGRYVWNFISRGDLGTSYISRQSISSEVMERFPTTMKLAFFAIALGVAIGIPLGVWSAVKQYTWIDSAILVISMIAVSMPNFWLALLLISLFSVNLNWLPAVGISNPLGWIMPILVISCGTLSGTTRITRSSMLEVIRQDYIRTARAKGQKEKVVITKHALRNALIPVITNIGISFGVQLGGSVTVEQVFSIPGIGKYVVDAISNRNYPAVCGSVVILAIVFTLVNLLVDIVYTIVDPRLKSEYASKKLSRTNRKQLLIEQEGA